MWWLKKRRKKEQQSIQWTATTKVIQLVLNVQHRWAAWLAARSSGWTRQQTKLYLVCFCVVFATPCVLILVRAFSDAPALKVSTTDKMPLMPAIKPTPEQTFTDQDIADILSFNRYLDSLQTTPEGMRMYQELAHDRPGLIDSLRAIQSFITP